MNPYVRAWTFGALCAVSALAGGWAVAATLARGDDGNAMVLPHEEPFRADAPAASRMAPRFEDRPLYEDRFGGGHPRLIAC